MKQQYEVVKKEALEHHIVNGIYETYIIKNDEGFYYCEGNNAGRFHYNDHMEGKNPVVIGYYVKACYHEMRKVA